MNKEKILLPKDSANARAPWLWIGSWSMGGEGYGNHDARESLKVLRTAVENDIRHFDTAGFYAHGKSEKLIQKIIRRKREEFFISTKGGVVWNGRRVEHRASPGELELQLYESLERLKTDYLDLYQLHWPDPEIPLDESIGALKEFRKRGFIRYWGVGNLREKDIQEYLTKEKNVPHQVHFNPIHQNRVVLNAGKDRCINCVVSPLEQGLLGAGKSAHGREGVGKKDIRTRNPYFSDVKALEWNNKLKELLRHRSIPKVCLVLMWICAQSGVHVIVPGPRRMEQLKEIFLFKSLVEKESLYADESAGGILSEDKVKRVIPAELYNHLSKGLPRKR